MLSPDFDAIGMGHVYANGIHYWAMELGNVSAAGDSGIDGDQTVTVEIQNSSIHSLSTEKDTYQTVSGNTIDLPTVNAVAEAPTFWPEGGSAVVTVENPDWKIDNELIARITGGKLLGKSAGTTTLTASVGSEKVTVTIEVLPNDNEEDNGPGNNGDGDNDPGNNGEEDNDPGNSGEEGNNPGNEENGGSSSGNGGSSGSKGNTGKSSGGSAAAETIIIPTTSIVGGVQSATEGVYMATHVNGTIVVTDKAAIAQNYSLANNEKPYAKFSDFDVKKSLLAKQSIDSVAAAQGAVVGPILNIELGKMTDGKYSLLPADGSPIRLSVGIPKSFMETGKTYGIVCVRTGGSYAVLKDLDNIADTITFETAGGAGVYALIKY